MKQKSPPFTWEKFLAALAQDPNCDPFAKFSFRQVSRADKQVIADRVMAARLAVKPKQEMKQ